MVDLPLHDPAGYPLVAGLLAGVVAAARSLPRVDAERIALWCFSGGGLLAAGWLREPPRWLRCLALSYPVLAPLPGWRVDPWYRPAEALSPGAPPVVLTRAGRDLPDVAATVPPFLARARELSFPVEIVDVPDGRHGFDGLDHTEASREAVRTAFDLVLGHLDGPCKTDPGESG